MAWATTQTPALTDLQALDGRARWLVRHRFIAVCGVLLAVAVARSIDAVDGPWGMVAVTVTLLALNLLFRRAGARARERADAAGLRRLIAAQLVADLGALTALLHFAGGADNPFALFYLFHVVIAALILPLGWAIGLAVLAVLLPLGSAALTAAELLAAHPLRLGQTVLGTPEALAATATSLQLGRAFAYTVTVGGLTFFVSTIARRLRQAEARRLQHARVAASRERLARIGAIAGGVAHTIRNPLHGVLNCVSMLGEDLDPDDPNGSEQRELVALALEGVDRIEKVTRRLQALRRDAPFRTEPVDLAALAAECIKFMEVRAREAGVSLELCTEPTPLLQADPNRLSEALLNLLDNAIYACQGTGQVTIRVHGGEGAETAGAAGRTAHLEVADTGVGVDPASRAELFDPFVTSKPVGEGSGLGLAIVQRVATEHGGRVQIDGALGRGTVVSLDLPCDIAEPTDG